MPAQSRIVDIRINDKARNNEQTYDSAIALNGNRRVSKGTILLTK